MFFKKSKNNKYKNSSLRKTRKKQKYKNNSSSIQIMKGGGPGSESRLRTDGTTIVDRHTSTDASRREVNVKEYLLFRLKFFPGETTQTDKQVLDNLFDFTQTPLIFRLMKGIPKRLRGLTERPTPDFGSGTAGDIEYPEASLGVNFQYGSMKSDVQNFKDDKFNEYMNRTKDNILELNQKLKSSQ